MKKSMTGWTSAVACCLASVAMAATVTINPGNGVETNVTARFTGALAHESVLRFYREHPVDLFVLVSKSEGLPVSVMEALSFGVPAVVTDVGGCAELVCDGENGYVLPADFTDELLRQTIRRAMCATDDLRAAAFETWRSRFTADNFRQFVQTLLSADDH